MTTLTTGRTPHQISLLEKSSLELPIGESCSEWKAIPCAKKTEPARNLRVLLVDSAEIVCEQLAAMISRIEGVEIVGTARTAQKAAELILESKPGAAVMEFRLPDGTCIDILKATKNCLPFPRVIVCSYYPLYFYNRMFDEYKNAEHFLNKSEDFYKIPRILERWKRENAEQHVGATENMKTAT